LDQGGEAERWMADKFLLSPPVRYHPGARSRWGR